MNYNLSGVDFRGVHGDVSAVVAVVVRMIPGNVGDDTIGGGSIAIGAEVFHLCSVNFRRIHRVLSKMVRLNPTASSSVSGHMSCTGSGDLSGLRDLGRNGASQQENGGNLDR